MTRRGSPVITNQLVFQYRVVTIAELPHRGAFFFRNSKMILTTFIIVGIVATVSADGFIAPYPPYGGSEDRPATLYNHETQKCCKGVAHPIHSLRRCCGNLTYDFTEEICCDSVIQPLIASVRTQCCGVKAYDVKSALCCDGKVEGLPDPLERELFSCCYSQMYDTRTHLCCGDEVVKKVSPNAKCCGLQTTYNPDIEACCDFGNSVIPKTWPNTAVCAGEAYNADTHMCCAGQITESSRANSSCCGTTPYNPETEICCMDNVIANPEGQMSCCGEGAVDYRSQLCCGSEIHNINQGLRWKYYCCGDQMCNSDSHVCCNGNMMERATHTTECCDDQLYDSEKQLCCYFNGTSNLLEKPTEAHICCGGTAIDPTKQICCYGDYNGYNPTAHDVTSPSLQCCDKEVFDSATSICCNGKIHPKPTAESASFGSFSCCGQELFYSHKEACCDGKVFKINDPEAQTCCTSYDTDEHDGCSRPFPPVRPYPMPRPYYHNNAAAMYGADRNVVDI